ncbi:MAG: hypothetical protein AAF224_09815 [Pseudomonadota bacterium]
MTNLREGDDNIADTPENKAASVTGASNSETPDARPTPSFQEKTNGSSAPRVRFQGVVDAGDPEAHLDADLDGGRGSAAYFNNAAADNRYEDGVEIVRPTNWRRLSRQLAFWTRIWTIFVFVAMLIFWPVTTAATHLRIVGSLDGWNIIAAYPTWAVIFTLVAPVMLLAFGHIVSRQILMMDAAEKIALSAQQLTEPDRNAVFNVQSVGAAVRTQIGAVNAGIDDALIRLASVEAMIRQHVEAIEQAGTAIETRATGSLDLVANERAKLMQLTEQLNAQADDFAVAIAEKAQANIDSFNSVSSLAGDAEAKLDERLRRLETIAERALSSFEALGHALETGEDKMASTVSALRASSDDVQKASAQASKVAEEAAAAAARNALNVGQFSRKAAEEAEKAAQGAIETAREETEKAADAAVEAAKTQSERIADAVVSAVETMTSTTDETVKAAASEADRAVKASEALSEAATKATDAALKAGAAVQTAGAAAQDAADKAHVTSEETAARLEERNKELSDARAALETENKRLESLIQEQRQRADRLADAIATQTERLSRLAEVQLREQEAAARIAEAEAARDALAKESAAKEAEAKNLDDDNEDDGAEFDGEQDLDGDVTIKADEKSGKRNSKKNRKGGAALKLVKSDSSAADEDEIERGPARSKEKEAVSWREILNATDDAEPIDLAAEKSPPAPGEKPQTALDAVEVVHRLQNFTLNLDRRLYGEAPKQLLERFDRGDRNLFAHRLLRLNEADVKRRIRIESGRDEAFEKAIHEFLQGFESLLEEATTSDTADEDLEEYLGSPLGRVYLLIGATVGYFA